MAKHSNAHKKSNFEVLENNSLGSGFCGPVYASLMHPEIRQTELGDCPKCQMHLDDLPDLAEWSEYRTPNAKRIAMRYRSRFDEEPGAYAAHGIFAARKIDHAMHASNGLSSLKKTRKVQDASTQGIDW